MSFSVAIVRPYDPSTRKKVSAAIEQAGGRVVRVFEDPIVVATVSTWLQDEAPTSSLVVPFNVFGGETGIDLLVELLAMLPEPRRVLMPVKVASATAVSQLLEKALGGRASDVLPLSLETISTPHGVERVRTFLTGILHPGRVTDDDGEVSAL